MTMELSIAITVLALAVCFVCFAIFCLFYARFKLKYGHIGSPAHRGTREEMESVMSSPVDFKYGMQTLEMGAARPSTTSDADREQWEIDVPDEAETEYQSETGKSPQRKSLKSGGKRRGRSRRSDKLRRPKYQQVDSEKVDVDHDENDGAENADAVSRLNTVETAVDDRNAYDFRSNDCLKIVDIPSSKPSVSPPSTVSMLKANKKIAVQDVQPAFYVPGFSHMLASPPLPPQPNRNRFDAVPKPEHSEAERDGDHGRDGNGDEEDLGPSFIASPTVTALSEVTASTKLGRGHQVMRSITNLTAGWNDDEEHKTLVMHSMDGDAAEQD